MNEIIRGADIAYEFITTEEQRVRAIEFAKSFSHDIGTWRYPVFVSKIGERWLGFHQIYNGVVLFNGWNPNTTTPRDTIEAMKQIVGWGKLQFGGGMTATPIENTKFTPSLMERFGMKRMGMELWEVK